MKKILLVMVVSVFFLLGCTTQNGELDLSNVSDEDVARVSREAVVCNAPYMRVGLNCCLDANANSICDRDEFNRTTNTTLQPPLVVCNAPYIRVGPGCCLDSNNNSICDSDELPPVNQTNTTLVCNAPYILNGTNCCLDTNNNNICDAIEVPINTTINTTVNTTINTTVNTTVNTTINQTQNQTPVLVLNATGGITDPTRIVSQSSLALPQYNQPFIDPDFNTTIRRITNRAGSGGFGTHIYSQLQAFSSDDQYILLIEDEGYVVKDRMTLQNRPLDTSEWNDPRWQPAAPNTIVHYDGNGDSVLRVQYTNIETGQVQTVYTFPSQYTHIRPQQSFDELSHDGRWMAGLARRSSGSDVIFAVDLENRSLGAQLPLSSLYGSACAPDPTYGQVEPDWIGVSPLGRYLVVQWKRDGSSRCSGLETFDIQTGAFVGHINDGHQHGDLGVLPDNTTEIFMTFGLSHPVDNNRPGQMITVLPGPSTGTAQQQYILPVMDWYNQEHISGQGPNGMFLVTAGRNAAIDTPFEGEVFIHFTDNRVLRLTHHRSTSCDYWVQPRASISHSGRYAVFSSDWGTCQGGNGDAYLVEVPGYTTLPVVIPPLNQTNSTIPPQNQTNSTVPTNTTQNQTLLSGALPASRTLNSTEGVNFGVPPASEQQWYPFPIRGANYALLTMNNYIGTPEDQNCQSPDFTTYRLFRAPVGSTNYTQLDMNNPLVVQRAFNGCVKTSQEFKVTLTPGRYCVAMCISQADFSQNYCTKAGAATVNLSIPQNC